MVLVGFAIIIKMASKPGEASLCPMKKGLGHIEQQLGLTLTSRFDPTFFSYQPMHIYYTPESS